MAVFVCPELALGQPKDTAENELVNCKQFRAKRKDVPVYSEPMTTAKVIRHLELGERVCYVGEQGDFAILDWRNQGLVNSREEEPKDGEPDLAFARLVDLWEGEHSGLPAGSDTDIVEQAKEQLNYLRHGWLAEDVFAPYRMIFSPFMREPQCRAGKICEVLEQQKMESQEKDDQEKKQ